MTADSSLSESSDWMARHLASFPVSSLTEDEWNDLFRSLEGLARAFPTRLRFCCRGVKQCSPASPWLYEIAVGPEVDLSTWREGGVLLRPPEMDRGEPNEVTPWLHGWEELEAARLDRSCWRGQIVRVNAQERSIHVVVADPWQPPRLGLCFAVAPPFTRDLVSFFRQHRNSELAESLSGRCRAALHGAPAAHWRLCTPAAESAPVATLASEVASLLQDPRQRVLWISPGHAAADQAVLQLHTAMQTAALPELISLRVGVGSDWEWLQQQGCARWLEGTEIETMRLLSQIAQDTQRELTPETRRARMRVLLRELRDISTFSLLSHASRIVVTTAAQAGAFLQSSSFEQLALERVAPFTTVILENADAYSRATTAALSLLAADCVWLSSGESAAVFPRRERLVATSESKWLLSHALELEPIHTNARQSRHAWGNQLLALQPNSQLNSAEWLARCAPDFGGGAISIHGVAGSGKTPLLKAWLLRLLQDWRARLHGKILLLCRDSQAVQQWKSQLRNDWQTELGDEPFPMDRVEIRSFREMARRLVEEAGLKPPADDAQFLSVAYPLLATQSLKTANSHWHALFVDDAQALPTEWWPMLEAQIKPLKKEEPGSRLICLATREYPLTTESLSNPFAQTPIKKNLSLWEHLPSTRNLLEFAATVACKLNTEHPSEASWFDPTSRGGELWRRYAGQAATGLLPQVKSFISSHLACESVGQLIVQLVMQEHLPARSMQIVVPDHATFDELFSHVHERLSAYGLRLELAEIAECNAETGVACITLPPGTSHRPPTADVVIVLGSQALVTPVPATGTLHCEALLQAMLAAKNLLYLIGWGTESDHHQQQVLSVLQDCQMLAAMECEENSAATTAQEINALAGRLGEEHRVWLEQIWRTHRVELHPFVAADGAVLAEPLFWFETPGQSWLCFDPHAAPLPDLKSLALYGVQLLEPGGAYPCGDRSEGAIRWR